MSALAVAVRTALSGLAGVALSAAAINWTTDWRPGLITVGLALLTVLVAAVAAGLLARSKYHATTPLGKAVAQFCQLAAAGLATVSFNTVADVAVNGRLITTLLITSAFSALSTFFLNASEQGQVA